MNKEYYKFERVRLGKRGNYGNYLYRGLTSGKLLASPVSPYNEKRKTSFDYDDYFMLFKTAKPQQIFTLKKDVFIADDIDYYDCVPYYKDI